jgi:hypothetical protein
METTHFNRVQTTATSPRGRKYTVSIVSSGRLTEIALLDDNDEFIRFNPEVDDDVAYFSSFEKLSQLMTLIREKIIDLDVGWSAELQQSMDLHPAGKLKIVK